MLKNSPLFSLLFGGATTCYALSCIFSGQMQLNKNGRMLYFADSPGLFVFSVSLMLLIGLGLIFHAWRLWSNRD